MLDIKSQLKQVSIFSSLKEEEIIEVFQNATSRKYLKGEYVTHKGDKWPYLLLVISGEFIAAKESGQGRFFNIETFKPNSIFWGLSLFELGKPNPVSIQSSKDGILLFWHKDQFQQIISSHTTVAWKVIGLLAKKMERVGEIVEELAFRPLTSRLANLLLKQLGDSKDGRISRILTLDEMAARIGSTREMVCKILYQFSDLGVIEVQRTELKIIDRLELENIESKIK